MTITRIKELQNYLKINQGLDSIIDPTNFDLTLKYDNYKVIITLRSTFVVSVRRVNVNVCSNVTIMEWGNLKTNREVYLSIIKFSSLIKNGVLDLNSSTNRDLSYKNFDTMNLVKYLNQNLAKHVDEITHEVDRNKILITSNNLDIIVEVQNNAFAITMYNNDLWYGKNTNVFMISCDNLKSKFAALFSIYEIFMLMDNNLTIK